MPEQIWVGEKLYKKLDQNRAKGQSFAGYIKENTDFKKDNKNPQPEESK